MRDNEFKVGWMIWDGIIFTKNVIVAMEQEKKPLFNMIDSRRLVVMNIQKNAKFAMVRAKRKPINQFG